MAEELPSPNTLVTHGLDFIESAVRLLGTETPSEQQAREAVVLLAIGMEALLKFRLMSEHWTLVFDKVENAKVSALRDGSLRSAGPEDCIKRLREICGVDFRGPAARTLQEFWEYRNKVVHFATHVGAAALRSRAFQVLSVMSDLVFRRGLLSGDAGDAVQRHARLHDALLAMEGYVTARHESIAGELAQAKEASFYCPYCNQCAVVLRDGARLCLFCLSDGETYGEITSHHLEREHGFGLLRDCGGANASCLDCEGWWSAVLQRKGSPTLRCLNCWRAADRSAVLKCDTCNHWFIPPRDGLAACPECETPA